jgi:hypothetical protein
MFQQPLAGIDVGRLGTKTARYDMAGSSKIDTTTPLEFSDFDREHPEEELVLAGLSDEETESVVTSTSDEIHSGSSSFASQDTARSSSKELPRSRSPVQNEREETRRLNAPSALDRLAAENERLALENSELRRQCLNIASSVHPSDMSTGAPPTHCDTPEMMSGDPLHALDNLPTFALPEAMQPEPMPMQDGVAFGFFPTNYVLVPMECNMSVASNMFQQPLAGIDVGRLGTKTARGRRGARAARAEQMFAKQPAPDTSVAPKQVARTQRVIPEDEPIQESLHDEIAVSSEPCTCAPHLRTTVMLRNLPNNYTRAMLLDLIDSEGYAKKYDFMYLPIDFNSKASLGYAFVNFTSPSVAQQFRARFHGFSNWILPSRKVCIVNWSGPHQGLEAHVERYRNSPVMHEAVPDIYKPVLFVDGKRATFPPPTKKLRAPRIRYFRNGNQDGNRFQGRNFGNSVQNDEAPGTWF